MNKGAWNLEKDGCSKGVHLLLIDLFNFDRLMVFIKGRNLQGELYSSVDSSEGSNAGQLRPKLPRLCSSAGKTAGIRSFFEL